MYAKSGIALMVGLFVWISTASAQTPKASRSDSLEKPENLDQAIEYLNRIFDDSLKHAAAKMPENDFSTNYHFGLGMSMRNNWGLWKGSPLSRYFNGLGIFHPDDMSSIILVSFHRTLTGKDVNLSEQINYYKAYWRANTPPQPTDYPEGVKKLEFSSIYEYETSDSLPGAVHVAEIPKGKDYWLYDNNWGWKKVTYEKANELGQTKDNRAEWVKMLFTTK